MLNKVILPIFPSVNQYFLTGVICLGGLPCSQPRASTLLPSSHHTLGFLPLSPWVLLFTHPLAHWHGVLWGQRLCLIHLWIMTTWHPSNCLKKWIDNCLCSSFLQYLVVTARHADRAPQYLEISWLILKDMKRPYYMCEPAASVPHGGLLEMQNLRLHVLDQVLTRSSQVIPVHIQDREALV